MVKIKNKELLKRLSAFVLAGTITATVSGCNYTTTEELSSSSTNYDTIDTNESIEINENIENSNGLTKGIKQTLKVDGEEFNLIIEYACDDSAWCITSDKCLYMTIYTDGLPEDKKVYIDDIHMDTSIVSTNAYLDGILQDTLDDGVHSSLAVGFPISDTNKYFGVNVIEGQNSEFVEGFLYGCSSIYGSVTTKRLLESDFLKLGVYANKITGVIGLLIEDKNTGEIIRGVDVPTTLGVEINNKITYTEKNYSQSGVVTKNVTYQYDKYGNAQIIEEVPIGKTLTKTKED